MNFLGGGEVKNFNKDQSIVEPLVCLARMAGEPEMSWFTMHCNRCSCAVSTNGADGVDPEGSSLKSSESSSTAVIEVHGGVAEAVH